MFRKLQVFNKTSNFLQAVKSVQVPLTEPGEEQIRVRNIYAGVNATDINITAARYFTDGKLPFDIGLEAIGLIDAVGSKVASFHVKQPVIVMKKQNFCGFSEYIYAEKDELIPLPELKPNYLVAFVNGLTASIALDKVCNVQNGDKVLITAASGGTGQMAVQWAKLRGAYVIAMTSSKAKMEYLKELKADFIINYREDDLDKILSTNFPDGVDIIWETMGGETFKTLFNHLNNRGRLLIIGSTPSYKDKGFVDTPIENLPSKLLTGSKSLSGFILFHYREFISKYLAELIEKIHKGEIKAKVDLGEQTKDGKFFGLDQIWRAEEHLHSGQNIGKVVVQIAEP